jgi:regulator of sigma E protease
MMLANVLMSLMSVWDIAWPILMFLIGLGVVVFVHELGHFLAAKWMKIRVTVFSLGMGPRVCGFKVGDTDYRLSALPIGGYISMTGQEDFAPAKEGDVDPYSFANKSVGARFIVIAAGVTMNVLFALLAYIVIGMIGINFYVSPTVGGVVDGMPAATAVVTWDDGTESIGLEAGDRIVSVNGRDIQRFNQVQMKALLANRDSTFEFVIERPTDDGVMTGTAEVGVAFAPSPTGTGTSMLAFGIVRPMSLTFAQLDGTRVNSAGIEAGDTLVAINGEPIAHAWELERFEEDFDGRDVELTLKIENGQTRTVTLTPTLYMTCGILADGRRVPADEVDIDRSDPDAFQFVWHHADGTDESLGTEPFENIQMDVLGLQPRMRVIGVTEGSRADDAGVMPGDIVLRYAGALSPTLQAFLDTSAQLVDDGSEATLIVSRDGETIEMTVRPKNRDGLAVVGTIPGIDQDHLVIAAIRDGSPVAAADPAPPSSGDTVLAVAAEPTDGNVTLDVTTWPELINALALYKAAGAQSVGLLVATPDGDVTVTVPLATFNASDYDYALFGPSYGFEPLSAGLVRYRNPLRAIAWGTQQTLDQLAMGYLQFKSLFQGNVSVKELRGPVGMGAMATQVARQGAMQFVSFMAFISVILAVVNFLPIPVVDGGHAVFLIIEKIRGRPLPVKVMNLIQMTGMVLLLGLMLLLTWRDIWQLISNMW